MSSECSQASSATPSLSSYPAEFRGAADYDRKPSNQYLLFHWNHTVMHYYCDECGSLVTTTGGIAYHGITTTNQNVDSAFEDSDTEGPARSSSISSSGRSRGGVEIHRSPAMRRQRPALVRMSPIYRPDLGQGMEGY
ncbi:hypothetical protein FIBSPDRAFT_965099 [Athelia psychrophila]|uniref:Uncharacterized protein n=1 Tax=Athelia psychrophila TaxID=1759441 RepID=A0A165X1M9_9AGAM|nr:hypothetical protein FIBSPDRAFT_965099 [Fibularhizoctonia sp. CBS 109695]